MTQGGSPCFVEENRLREVPRIARGPVNCMRSCVYEVAEWRLEPGPMTCAVPSLSTALAGREFQRLTLSWFFHLVFSEAPIGGPGEEAL